MSCLQNTPNYTNALIESVLNKFQVSTEIGQHSTLAKSFSTDSLIGGFHKTCQDQVIISI